MSGRFAAWYVWPAQRLGAGCKPEAACWLLAEWPEGKRAPTHFYFSNLAIDTPRQQLMRATTRRQLVKPIYTELKDKFGLDHFEGRGWTGWHHHISLVLVAYAFAVLSRHQRTYIILSISMLGDIRYTAIIFGGFGALSDSPTFSPLFAGDDNSARGAGSPVRFTKWGKKGDPISVDNSRTSDGKASLSSFLS